MRPERYLGLILTLSFVACGGEEEAAVGDDMTPSAPRRPSATTQSWSHEVVVDSGVGLSVKLAVGEDGRARLAYLADQGREDGLCEELGGDDLPTRMLWDLWYAEQRGASWNTEKVTEILSFEVPQGFDLAVAPDGTPAIAALTGEAFVQLRYCGANDLGFYTRASEGTWDVQTAVVNSGEAATGMPASDYGEVVGHYPGLAFDGNGNAGIAYKDVHAGGIQNDDFVRADMEFAYQAGGGWSTTAVDPGRGAGNHNRVLFDDQDRPIIVYYNPVEANVDDMKGLWVARSDDGGGNWERVRLFSASLLSPPSAVLDSDGKLHVAYYDPGRGVPVVMSQRSAQDLGSAADDWERTMLGDARYDEGYDPSLAVDSTGQMALSYYRCARTSSALGQCNPEDDALVFAYQEGDDWTTEVVDAGESQGQCGRSTSLAFESDGRPIIAYLCEDLRDESLVGQVRFASRDAL